MANDGSNGSYAFAFEPSALQYTQHWIGAVDRVRHMLRAQITEAGAVAETQSKALASLLLDPSRLGSMQSDFWGGNLKLWERLLDPDSRAEPSAADKDRRFAAPQWRDNPIFDIVRQSYLMLSEQMLKAANTLAGTDPRYRDLLRFSTQIFVDAMSPSNCALTNPQVLETAFETRGESLFKGFGHMLADLKKGQLTHTPEGAFEVGRNIAITPGKVVHETPLYQLIQYAPTTGQVLGTPLVIFPPWINRFYILDLNPEKSFVRWAVEQGLTVFIVSWKSADESFAGLTSDDYVLHGLLDAIDTVRAALDVESVHAIGYCVAGTHLAMLLAYLAAIGEDAKVRSATFFTTQVDFARAGDLQLFVSDSQLELIAQIAGDKGYLDGRYMALSFNLLRGRDLIWSYVVNNYLLGQDHPVFDLLFWNGDTTNLPYRWHRAYLEDLYRDNKLVQPGALHVGDTPVDLKLIKTPSYVQAGREDHIAPAESVWRITEHFSGPLRFVLAGSGHIAGVVNPPSSGKYQYWTNPAQPTTFEAFLADAIETKGSWWPDWIEWVRSVDAAEIEAAGARVPGKGALKAIENAPGRYVRMR